MDVTRAGYEGVSGYGVANSMNLRRTADHRHPFPVYEA